MHVAGHKLRPSLHPLERTFLAVVLVELVLLPWLWGTMGWLSQLVALGLSFLALMVALIPRQYDEDHALPIRHGNTQVSGLRPQVSGFRLHPWPRLLRFPLFWIGLLLLGYIAAQGFNPSWIWERNEKHWWLRRVTDIAWLPTSVDTPFERFSLWRQFIIYAAVWLTTCALWVGITRRKSLHILLGVLTGNGFVLATVGFIHRASGAKKLLWLQEFSDAGSFASFIYRNHAGGYFGLLVFVALGLAVWHYFEGQRRMARSTPAAVWLLGALFLLSAVVFSLSRGAAISVGVFGLAALLALLVLRLTTRTQSTTPVMVNVMVAALILGTVGFIVRDLNLSAVQSRFEQMINDPAKNPSVTSRLLARDAALEMYGDYWLRGVGAGGFRFMFPKYVQKRPEIYFKGRMFWEHAHIDWLQIPIELGFGGTLMIVAGAGWAAFAWLRSGGWKHPLALMVALGLGQVLLHAFMDFPLQCPAILVTWCALLVASLRWLELDGG